MNKNTVRKFNSQSYWNIIREIQAIWIIHINNILIHKLYITLFSSYSTIYRIIPNMLFLLLCFSVLSKIEIERGPFYEEVSMFDSIIDISRL